MVQRRPDDLLLRRRWDGEGSLASACGGRRVTLGGSGFLGSESADGKTVVYQPKDGEAPLLALPLSGGPTRELVKCAKPTAFSVASHSIYYVMCGSDPNPAVHVMDPLINGSGSAVWQTREVFVPPVLPNGSCGFA